MRTHATLRFHRREKILFHAPFPFQFRRNIDNVQRAIAELPRLHDVGSEIVGQGTGAAINLQSIPLRQRIDTAKFQNAFRAIFEITQNGKQIGNDHLVTVANSMNTFLTREHAVDLAPPALQYLHVNTESQTIEAADLDLLPPVRRADGIQIIAGETLQ